MFYILCKMVFILFTLRKLLMLKKLKRMLNRYLLSGVDVVLITSTGRTGTNFFEHFYTTIDPKAFVFHEPSPDLFDLSLQKIRYEKTFDELQNYIISNRASHIRSIGVFLKRLFRRPIILIEANPFIYPLISEYAPLFKSFRMIYITRSPDTYVLSAYRKDPKNDGVNNFYDDTDHRHRITAVDFGELTEQEWKALSRVERIAWYWNKCNSMLMATKIDYGESAIHIRFEDIFNDSREIKEKAAKNLLNFTHPKYSIEANRATLLGLLNNKKNASKALSQENSLADFGIDIHERVNSLVSPMRSLLGYNNS